MKAGPTIRKGKSFQGYSTPVDFLRAVEKRFGPIAFDLAADASNCVVGRAGPNPEAAEAVRRLGTPKPYFDVQDDSLLQDWSAVRGLKFLNPPFAHIGPWAAKCVGEVNNPYPTLLLTPASVGAMWFQTWVVPFAHVIELENRICFDGKNPFPKDCCLSVYYTGITGRSSWSWKE